MNSSVRRKRNIEKTKHMIDVVVIQHSKRIAGRIRRAHFGQATSSKRASTYNERQMEVAQKATAGLKSTSVGQKPQRICGQMRRLKAAFSELEETAPLRNRIRETVSVCVSLSSRRVFLPTVQ